MAAVGAPVRVPAAVALRVLGLSRQGYYQWLKAPVSQRDWDDAHLIDVLYDLHADDVTLGYRFLTDELESEHGITASENRVQRLCRIAGTRRPTTASAASLAARDLHRTTTSSPWSTSTVSSGTSSPPTARTRSGSGTSRNTRPLHLRDQGHLVKQDRRLLHRHPDEVVVRTGGDA